MRSVWKRSQQGRRTTRQRILQVARLIRYAPNLAARALSVAKASAQGQLACECDNAGYVVTGNSDNQKKL
jgi:DNA-binding LacI/PurR family transcriptional regulator